MSSPNFRKGATGPENTAGLADADRNSMPRPHRRGMPRLWVTLDLLTVLFSVLLALEFKHRTGLMGLLDLLRQGQLLTGYPMGTMSCMLLGFVLVLVYLSQGMHLYHPERLKSGWREQRLSLQACLTAGFLLAGALYLAHAGGLPRTLVVVMVSLVAFLLGLRRLTYRVVMARRFARGLDRRNVMIVGSGPEAQALRHHLESLHGLGYTFKGFVNAAGLGKRLDSDSGEAAEALDMIFRHARRLFVDEIFLTAPCAPGMVHRLMERARESGIDLRVIPDTYDGLAWNSTIEYIGQFPTIPLQANRVPELALTIKWVMDLVIALVALLVLWPLGLVAALAIKLDSPGPVFYCSDRIGKKGRIFRCIKFRTMVADADQRRADLMHLNERDGVLFKVANDPRITRVGRVLRKFSIDELPQFWNVLIGDMSVVGPRPPLAVEVRDYELEQLRRLDVMPGITGLWQVQARQDPSFNSYVLLDMTYIEQWTLWLDIKILLKTIKVVLAGTGS